MFYRWIRRCAVPNPRASNGQAYSDKQRGRGPSQGECYCIIGFLSIKLHAIQNRELTATGNEVLL